MKAALGAATASMLVLMIAGPAPQAADMQVEGTDCMIRPATLCADQDLEGVGLREADLRMADLSRAALKDANLRAAKLDDADFAGADTRDCRGCP